MMVKLQRPSEWRKRRKRLLSFFHVIELCTQTIERKSIFTHKKQRQIIQLGPPDQDAYSTYQKNAVFWWRSSDHIHWTWFQKQISQFTHALKESGLTINIKRNKRHVSASPLISIDEVILEATDHFIYQDFTSTKNLSFGMEIDKHIAKAAAAALVAKLIKSVWNNNPLTLHT